MRNLFLFILLLVAIWWFRRSLRGTDRQSPAQPESPPTAASGENERMLACAHCGVLVPLSEGIGAAGAFFCSQEHARLGPHDKAS